MRLTHRILTTAAVVPALLATTFVAQPANAVEVGADSHGTTEITPKPVSPEVPVENGASLGAITAAMASGNVANLTAASGKIRVTFLSPTVFRIEATRGEFTDPANTPQNDPQRTANIIVGAQDFSGAAVSVTDGATIVVGAANGARIEIVKATGLMTAKAADGSVIWQEKAPLSFGARSTTQSLVVRPNEQFLGGGMQNGRSIHTGATINVAKNFDWDDDGYPNSVPWYMTSGGYGMLRNTFERGSYNFATGTTTHEETRYDSYTFAGDYKAALDGYTKLTGRPMMPPVYALEYGDADCYNRGSATYEGSKDPKKLTTPQSLDFAKEFVTNDMPAGWLLVNDGYGCEYVDLPQTVDAIEEQTDLKVGLWTQRSLTNQPFEVGEAGIRLRKLDVAWVGSAYRLALTGCEAAYKGIEENSDARGTSLMVEGWAGAQRCGMTWTGDHTGNLDAVRWQVSALTGSGNSGQPFTTGDVDGIFGGSTESYVRDLQWKAFAPALYSMSGWAPVDKRPWLYGEQATEINRDYLQLRQRLMPYIYSLSQNAHATGTPVMRSLALEYPQDLGSYSVEANNQFLLGTDYLVAPVFTAATTRSGIYLPAGENWVDYWSGRVYKGGQVLNGHPAPLDKLPIFVRAGAVVPQGIVARNASLVPEDSEITIQAYPSGTDTYKLYEDDKVTREYRSGKSSTQTFTVKAPETGAGDVSVAWSARQGSYTGMASARPYRVVAHTNSKPSSVTFGGSTVAASASAEALEAATQGWFFDETAGTVTVKIAAQAATAAGEVKLIGTSAVGGKDIDGQLSALKVTAEAMINRNEDASVAVTFTNQGGKPMSALDIRLTLPAGWSQVSASTPASTVPAGGSVTREFVVKAGATAKPGMVSISAVATYRDAAGDSRQVSSAVETELAYASLADSFNSIAITTVANAALGNVDGYKNSFNADAVAAAGNAPGAKVTVTTGPEPVEYTWPDKVDAPNTTKLGGQTIRLTGKGTHLAVVNTSGWASGGQVPLTFTYADGSTTTGMMGTRNWLPQGDTTWDTTGAFKFKGRNNGTTGEYEYTSTDYQTYQSLVPLTPGKELASVTLPKDERISIFAWTVVSGELPAPPTEDVYVSDHPWMSAVNGYGVIGKDVANKDSASSPDKPLTSAYSDPETGKKTYAKGLGVHAVSNISYFLDSSCSRLTGEASMEDGFNGSTIFTIIGDGKELFKSRTFVSGFAPDPFDVDLTGVQVVELRVDTPSGSINGAHGIWGDARFTCGTPADTTAPTVEQIEDVIVQVGGDVSVQVKAQDDSEQLAYSAEGLPAGVTIDEATGLISGAPTGVRVSTVKVTVTDPAGNATEVSFRITVEAAPSPTPTPSVTPTPSQSPTPKPTPTGKPSPTPTPKPGWQPSVPYTVPGTHTFNGRQWNTTCEDYSQTTRCRTDIWATTVLKTASGFQVKQGWSFNNLTYLPYMSREQWKDNPLGHAIRWTAADGRQWATECDTAATGRGACRSYTLTTVYSAKPKAGGGYAFTQSQQWVFNNIVLFRQ